MSAATTLPQLPIRPARESDDGFILDTWRESLRAESDIAKASTEAYRLVMLRHIRRLSREPGAVRLVCYDPQDDDTLVGYAVATGHELHYVYVRREFRRMGIARSLVEQVHPASYSITTPMFERRMHPHERGWVHTPRQVV